MNIRRYTKNDYKKIIEFLTNEYFNNNNNITSWLPQRFDDLINRIDILYSEERNQEKSSDYIFIFEDNNSIVGLILPDGDSFNSAIKPGYEYIYSNMLDLAEKELLPLYSIEEDGSINFVVFSHDSLKYQQEELLKRGYIRNKESDYDNVTIVKDTNYIIELPDNYELVYGDNIEDIVKCRTCHYGFHPDDDDNNLYREHAEGDKSYYSRKNSIYFKDSFETLIKTKDNDYCSYCFCYIDKVTKTGFIEPVSTRLKYRKLGLCKQMLHGVINRCKELGIEKVYINSFDWRVNVYNGCGFNTIDTVGYYTKKLIK